ncbi:MAG: ATP-binding protein [bacterium]
MSRYTEQYYKNLTVKTIARLLFTYLIPLIILTFYFHFQYNALIRRTRLDHLRSTSEYQANILDLFLRERVANLSNLIDDPAFPLPPSSTALQTCLKELKSNSDTFEDIGFFDSSGHQVAYAGPFPHLEQKDYTQAPWYISLKEKKEPFIITDMYLGFRNQPHFTIGVRRTIDDQYVVLRATFNPGKIYEYLSSIQESQDVFISIVNPGGYYQLVKAPFGTLMDSASILPPQTPRIGTKEVWSEGILISYGYSWLRIADWALIVQEDPQHRTSAFSGIYWQLLIVSSVFILVIFLVILIRGKSLVQFQKEADQTKVQLEHAAKLASVGELAAGIAHEINNPLAIVSEEAGLMKDLLDPQFNEEASREELCSHLDEIQQAAFRCRDITHKLLSFVRKDGFSLETRNIHELIDEVVDGLLGRRLAVSDIEVRKTYDLENPHICIDSNQLRQVLLNLLTNAIDAITPPGRISIRTSLQEEQVHIAISDTGTGISRDRIEKIFLPFYTTKEVGQGTGLGLSVSYGIIKNLGGSIRVESEVGKGSTFVVILPMQ